MDRQRAALTVRLVSSAVSHVHQYFYDMNIKMPSKGSEVRIRSKSNLVKTVNTSSGKDVGLNFFREVENLVK